MHESAAVDARSIASAAVSAGPRAATGLACPPSRQLRDRLRAMASDLVASWKAEGMPAAARSAAGLRGHAETLVKRAAGGPEHAGWTMVAIVSEFWRDRLAAGPGGRRLLLLPDCPACGPDTSTAGRTEGVPRTCGPSCGVATIWAAARDSGWAVESTSQAVSAIGALLTGQYDGILGVARLADLEKAFAMLPAFSLPIAAVPCDLPAGGSRTGVSCADALAAAAIDVEWVLGLLGVAGGGSAPVGDYLPLLREAAGMFTPAALDELDDGLGLGGALGGGCMPAADCPPLDATAAMAGEFLTRGGKFLRPFVTLAAFDAVAADLRDAGRAVLPAAGYAADLAVVRQAARAAAVAIEVFHKASLVHDDIEDDDAVRYGRPTLHTERGVAAAINVGDHLLGVGYRIVSGLPGLDAGTLRDVVSILADAHVRLARGQGAELWWRDARDKKLSAAEALAIYGLKTSPAFEAAVAIGVRLAGVTARDAGALDRYAMHVGTGFQVLNDLKDWSGDLENDRRAAGDLLGGRPTLLWALALERLTGPRAARLLSAAALARGPGDPCGPLAEIRSLYAEAGVVTRAVEIAQEQRRRAAEAVAACRLPRLREVLEFLLDLAVPEPPAPPS